MLELTEFIPSEWKSLLWQKLCGIRNERNQEIEFLADTFGDPYALADVYVEPQSQNTNPADADEDEPIRFVTSPVFSTLNKFFKGEFHQKRDGRHQMFILSDAGMGKTSLLLMLALTHLTKFWPQDHNCKLLKIGPNTEVQINAIRDKAKTILLLDALDEDPIAWGRIKDRLIQLLQVSQPFRRVIISCRTQFFPAREATRVGESERVEIGGFRCPLIFLSLFDDKQVREYLEKRFSHEGSEKERETRIAQSLALLRRMGSLCMRPLLLSHIDDLLEYPDQEWNEYTIYRALVDIWLLREERTLKRHHPSSKVTKEALRRACSAIASRMQHAGKRELAETALTGWLDEVPDLRHLGSLHVGGRSLLNRNSRGDFRFSHYTVQEFLVAEALLKKEFFGPREGTKLTQKVLEFMQGTRSKISLSEAVSEPLQFDLRGVDFSGLNISDLTFRATVLDGANFSAARCLRTDFSCARMTGVNMEKGDFRDCLFSGGVLDSSTLAGSICAGAKFSATSLRGCDARLRVDFSRCNFEDADFSECKLAQANLSGANMKACNLSNSDLSGANLHSVIMDDANLTNAILENADLALATLRRTNLTNANFSLAKKFNAKQQGMVFNKTRMPDGEENTGTLQFRPPNEVSMQDFRKNASPFITKLKTAPPDDVSEYILQQFSETTQQAIAAWSGYGEVSPTLQKAIVLDLNRIVNGPSIWHEKRFSKVKIRPEIRDLVKRTLQGGELARLNRLLLEDTYPNEMLSPRVDQPTPDFVAFLQPGTG